ncbi:MAG TPA: methionyl-tRNA formyltransferase [Polyangiaceae bacterium]|nr:methionyl-tRNA formyltransferase [Polyangiaceae bacterium]
MTIRSVFFGTPGFAVPALRALHAATQVVGVVCQPDRRAGRGMNWSAPPVKQAALELELPVHQPERVRSGELERWLGALQADVALVAAYGRILPRGVLDAPRRGCLNLHASILPEYRGAAPIQWAILQGKTETGISLMQMDEGMDTGAVFATRRLAIPPSMNGGELTDALAALAAEMVGEELLAAVDGRLQAVPQESGRATNAPPIRREHLAIDWTEPSARVLCQIRAFAPSPSAFTLSGGRRLKVLEARLGASNEGAAPGQVLASGQGKIEVACGSGSVELVRAQSENGKPQSARDLLNGRLLQPGQRLGPEEAPG